MGVIFIFNTCFSLISLRNPNEIAIPEQPPVEGEIYVCGRGTHNYLGRGSTEDVLRPVSLQLLRGRAVVKVACGEAHTVRNFYTVKYSCK